MLYVLVDIHVSASMLNLIGECIMPCALVYRSASASFQKLPKLICLQVLAAAIYVHSISASATCCVRHAAALGLLGCGHMHPDQSIVCGGVILATSERGLDGNAGCMACVWRS